MSIVEQIQRMTLEEKASLCSGQDFWYTKAVERVGIPSIMMTDGPHGMRKQPDSDQVGLHGSVPATCFPSGSALASSWNRELISEVSAAMAAEAQAEGVRILLGPAVNIKRSPLCGRNFEYLSEDPFLAGELAKHHILGLQGGGVGASLKHFAANNQERYRLVVDAVIDERTLREIYLPAFEKAVKEARPWTVMCAYNRLNGTYCAENRWLLTEVLKEEWGHEGIVVTDWGACNDRVAGLAAGQELEMPGNGGINDRLIVEAVTSGRLDESVLDSAVRRLLELVERAGETARPGATFDPEAHHALARRVAGECVVLLKNDAGILPLAKSGKLAVIGAFAEHTRYQGGGSSHINPTRLDSALEELRRGLGSSGQVVYAPGYSLADENPDRSLIDEAVAAASSADTAIVFIGLPDSFESEGFDRTHLDIPASHRELLAAVRAVQKRVVVVLSNGSPITMPWLSEADAVLEAYLTGQAAGGAVADVLFGDTNPSGKLAETFPLRLEDTPSYLNFPGEKERVDYREGLFVGYRYYDAVDSQPLFPFGFGLSYTTFEYGELTLDRTSINDGDTLTASVKVRNSGRRAGKEIVQLYVHDDEASVIRPSKELKGFEKVALDPGESTTVRFRLDRRAFAFWEVATQSWRVEAGSFTILAGASSRDIRLEAHVEVRAEAPVRHDYDWNATLADFYDHPVVGELTRQWRSAFLSRLAGSSDGKSDGEGNDDNIGRMMRAMVDEFPLRTLVRMSGTLGPDSLELFLDVVNGKAPTERLKELAG